MRPSPTSHKAVQVLKPRNTEDTLGIWTTFLKAFNEKPGQDMKDAVAVDAGMTELHKLLAEIVGTYFIGPSTQLVKPEANRPFDTFDFSKEGLDSFIDDSVGLTFSCVWDTHGKRMWVSGNRFGIPVNDEEEFFIALNAFIGGPRAHQDLDITMDLGTFETDPAGRFPLGQKAQQNGLPAQLQLHSSNFQAGLPCGTHEEDDTIEDHTLWLPISGIAAWH